MLDMDILRSFNEESRQLLDELSEVLGRIEQSKGEFPTALFDEFAQKIDRIMGSAKTIGVHVPSHQGLIAIGKLAELCKYVGYKAAQKKDVRLVPICAAFWADTLENLNTLMENLENQPRSAEIAQGFTDVIQTRLKWLAGHLKE
jgi:chemotaxis protein histidine kinase CheA